MHLNLFRRESREVFFITTNSTLMADITSIQNPKIKHIALLQQKSAERRKSGLFIVEGQRELGHCLAAGYEIDSLYVLDSKYDSLFSGDAARAMVDADGNVSLGDIYNKVQVNTVTPQVYEKIAYRGSTEGILAVVKTKQHTLAGLKMADNPLVIVLEGVEKPGNLGAILRTADAAGVDAVLVCDPLTDLYNPNLIRSAIGAIFTVPVATCTSEECIAYLKDKGIKILTAQLQDSRLYYDQNMTAATAIVMGTESTGLTDIWRNAADAHIRIPMLGKLDSLNVSVSTAVLVYEAVRQRSQEHK